MCLPQRNRKGVLTSSEQSNCPYAAFAPLGTSPEGKLWVGLQHFHHSSCCLGGNVFFTKIFLSSQRACLTPRPGRQASERGIEPGFCVLKQKRNVIRLLRRLNAIFHLCRIDIVILNSTKTATPNVKLPLPTR